VIETINIVTKKLQLAYSSQLGITW